MGEMAVATGFAFKDYLASILAGIVVLFERPYRQRDCFPFEDVDGEVKEMGMHAARLLNAPRSVVARRRGRATGGRPARGRVHGALAMRIVVPATGLALKIALPIAMLALALPNALPAQTLDDLSAIAAEAVEPKPNSIAQTRSPGEDQRLAARLTEIFTQVEGLGSVSIDVRSGVVVLSGVVFSSEAHQKALRIAHQLEGVVEVQDEISESRDVQQRLSPVLSDLRERSLGFLAGLPLLAVSLSVFALFLLVGRLVGRWDGLYRRISRNAFARDLARQAVRLGFVLLGALVALEILDATAVVAAVAGIAGLAGLAISFAFRDLAENYIASVLLSLRQPFQADELVRIGVHDGRVVRLTSRATILIDLDGNHVRIPNAAVFKGTILNYSRNPQRRFGFAVGVASDSDLAAAIALGVSTLAEMPGISAEPEPGGWVEELGDWNIVLRFTAWIDQRETDWFKARGEAIRLVKEAFDAADIVMPDALAGLRAPGEGELGSAAAISRDRRPVEPGQLPAELDIASEDTLASAVARDRASAEDDLLDSERPRE